MELGELVSEQAAHELCVADLSGEAGEARCNLGVEYRPYQADHWQQDLQVLARSVHHLGDRARGEERGERCEIRHGERIDAGGVTVRRQLQQAQLRTVGALAQELCVESDARLAREAGGERAGFGRGGDEGLQTRGEDDLYNRAGRNELIMRGRCGDRKP